MQEAKKVGVQSEEMTQLRIVPGTETQVYTPEDTEPQSFLPEGIDISALQECWVRCAALLNKVWVGHVNDGDKDHPIRLSERQCMEQSGIAIEGRRLLKMGVSREQLRNVYRMLLCAPSDSLSNLATHMFDMMHKDLEMEEKKST